MGLEGFQKLFISQLLLKAHVTKDLLPIKLRIYTLLDQLRQIESFYYSRNK